MSEKQKVIAKSKKMNFKNLAPGVYVSISTLLGWTRFKLKHNGRTFTKSALSKGGKVGIFASPQKIFYVDKNTLVLPDND